MLKNIVFSIVKWVYTTLSSLPDSGLLFLIFRYKEVAVLLLRTFVFRSLRSNIERCFPKMENIEIDKIAHGYIDALGQFAFDFIKSLKADVVYMKKKVEFENLEILDELFQQTPYVICFSGHLLDYEMLITLPLFRPEYAMCNIYQSTDKNDIFEKWISKERCKYGAFALPSTSAYKILLNIKEYTTKETGKIYRGHIIGVLGDTDPGLNSKLSIQFLNNTIQVYTGAERIGKKLNAAFVYANISHKANGRYTVSLEKLNISENSNFGYTQKYFEKLESNIKSQPENWLLWNTNRFRASQF